MAITATPLTRTLGAEIRGIDIAAGVDQIDFVENEEDLGKIIEKIDAELNGLF